MTKAVWQQVKKDHHAQKAFNIGKAMTHHYEKKKDSK